MQRVETLAACMRKAGLRGTSTAVLGALESPEPLVVAVVAFAVEAGDGPGWAFVIAN